MKQFFSTILAFQFLSSTVFGSAFYNCTFNRHTVIPSNDNEAQQIANQTHPIWEYGFALNIDDANNPHHSKTIDIIKLQNAYEQEKQQHYDGVGPNYIFLPAEDKHCNVKMVMEGTEIEVPTTENKVCFTELRTSRDVVVHSLIPNKAILFPKNFFRRQKTGKFELFYPRDTDKFTIETYLCKLVE